MINPGRNIPLRRIVLEWLTAGKGEQPDIVGRTKGEPIGPAIRARRYQTRARCSRSCHCKWEARHAHGELQKDILLTRIANFKAKYKKTTTLQRADNTKQKRQFRQHNGNKAYLEQGQARGR